MKEIIDAAKKVDKFLDRVELGVKNELESLRDEFKAEAKSVSKEAKEAFGSDIPSKKEIEVKISPIKSKILTDEEICRSLCGDRIATCGYRLKTDYCKHYADFIKVAESQLKKALE